MNNMTWYIDCYSGEWFCGNTHWHKSREEAEACPTKKSVVQVPPLNSYGPTESVEDVLKVVSNILSNPMSGIREIRIVPETEGCSPSPCRCPAV